MTQNIILGTIGFKIKPKESQRKKVGILANAIDCPILRKAGTFDILAARVSVMWVREIEE